jgi:serine phosphatase RsbU (regulator of sigma subunit)
MYAEHTIALQQGDIVVLYTDGIEETHKMVRGEPTEFGVEGIQNSVLELARNETKAIADGLLTKLAAFRGAGEQEDDASVILLKVK